MTAPTILIVAKAPVSGLAKTRLARVVGVEAAADIAAAALLDTIEVCADFGAPLVLSMTGNLDEAARGGQLKDAIANHRVVPQRGHDFAERLVNAHLDAASPQGVIQVGMDTPQLSLPLLAIAVEALGDHTAALGMASDGGWWALGLRTAGHARALLNVPMSSETTGARTHEALLRVGATVALLPVLTDVDEWPDALQVVNECAGSKFAGAIASTRTQMINQRLEVS